MNLLGAECLDIFYFHYPGALPIHISLNVVIAEQCDEGHFSSNGFKPKNGSCTPCPVGFYQSNNRSKNCSACESNEVTVSCDGGMFLARNSLNTQHINRSLTPSVIGYYRPL